MIQVSAATNRIKPNRIVYAVGKLQFVFFDVPDAGAAGDTELVLINVSFFLGRPGAKVIRVTPGSGISRKP
jgi:hypothetical protein